MFTGIVQGIATLQTRQQQDDLLTLGFAIPPGFTHALQTGASIAIDGVCLTVTRHQGDTAEFDLILPTLLHTTLADLPCGAQVNAERAACEGAEIGGHPLSGHVDGRVQLLAREAVGGNLRLILQAVPHLARYLFAQGYVALNGASLTIAAIDKASGRFEVWLIPETCRQTTLADKGIGQWLNLEIDRATQVVVDTLRETVRELLPQAESADAIATALATRLQAKYLPAPGR